MLRLSSISFLIASFATAATAQSGSHADYPSVWTCDASKFAWYCDVEDEDEPVTPPAIPVPQAVKPDPQKRVDIKDMKTAEQMRQELKRREDVAVMNPSDSNLKDYLELWTAVQDKGSVFADNWRRVVWQNPDLDYTLKRPANNSAIKVYDNARTQDEEAQLKMIAKEHGLIFFFRSDCPYCHKMAPSLKAMANQYGIEVLPVSVDGKGLPDFPRPVDGRAQAAAWGIERVPALFIGSKETGDHAPIGFGLMSVSEILNRVFVLTGSKPGENF